MNEISREQIGEAFDVEVEEMPTTVALAILDEYLEAHWRERIKPILLEMAEKLDREIMGDDSEPDWIRQRLEHWVSGTERVE